MIHARCEASEDAAIAAVAALSAANAATAPVVAKTNCDGEEEEMEVLNEFIAYLPGWFSDEVIEDAAALGTINAFMRALRTEFKARIRCEKDNARLKAENGKLWVENHGLKLQHTKLPVPATVPTALSAANAATAPAAPAKCMDPHEEEEKEEKEVLNEVIAYFPSCFPEDFRDIRDPSCFTRTSGTLQTLWDIQRPVALDTINALIQALRTEVRARVGFERKCKQLKAENGQLGKTHGLKLHHTKAACTRVAWSQICRPAFCAMSTTLDDQQRRRRLLELIQNLRHQLPDVRRRAAANLVTKATSGLLDDSAIQDATVSRMLCATAVQALHFELSYSSTGNAGIAVPEPSLLPLVTLCGTLARRPRLKQSLIEAGAIEALTALSGSTAVDQATAAAAQDALVPLLSVVCEPASPAQQSEHPQAALVHGAFPVPAPALPICEAQQQFDGSKHVEGHGATTITSGMAAVLRWPGWTRELVQGGALATIADGAVLRRVLCEGWSLPRVKLTKGDEQLLLDFEIRFRGCAEEATALSGLCHLWEELLEDFPAEVFLTRSGILGRLLSLMRGDSESASKTPKVQEQAMLTARRLVQGLVSSISQLLDPTLQPLQGAGEGGASWGAVTSLSAYRYPRTPRHQPLRSTDEGGAPCLSIGGCLFAIVCACTSLLSSAATDAHIAVSACELLQLVQPYLPEPGGWGDGDTPAAHTSGSDQHIAEPPRGSEGEVAKQLDVLRHAEYFALMARAIEAHGAADLRRVVQLPAPQSDLQGSLRVAVAMTTLRLLRQMPPAALSRSPGNAARRTVVVPGRCLSLLVQLAEDPVLRAHMPAAVESLAPHMAVLVPQTLADVAASQALIRKAHAALGDRYVPVPSAHAMADAAENNGLGESSGRLLEQLRQAEAALPFLNMVPEPRIVQNCIALWATAAAAASDDTLRGDAQREAQVLAQRLLLQLMNSASTQLTAYQALRDEVVGDRMPSEACVSKLHLHPSAAGASRGSSDNAAVRDEIAYQACARAIVGAVCSTVVRQAQNTTGANFAEDSYEQRTKLGAQQQEEQQQHRFHPAILDGLRPLWPLLEAVALHWPTAPAESAVEPVNRPHALDSTLAALSLFGAAAVYATSPQHVLQQQDWCAAWVMAAWRALLRRDRSARLAASRELAQALGLVGDVPQDTKQAGVDAAGDMGVKALGPEYKWLEDPFDLEPSPGYRDDGGAPSPAFNRPLFMDLLNVLSSDRVDGSLKKTRMSVFNLQISCLQLRVVIVNVGATNDSSARKNREKIGTTTQLHAMKLTHNGISSLSAVNVICTLSNYMWTSDSYCPCNFRVGVLRSQAAAAQLLPMLLTQRDAPIEQPHLRPQHGNSTATALQNPILDNSQQVVLQQQRPTDEDLASLLQVVLRAAADGDDQACELEAALLLLLAMVWRHAPCREYLRCSKVLLPLSRCVYHVRPAVRRIAANIATLLCFSTDTYLPNGSCGGGTAAEFAAWSADAGEGLVVLPAVHEAYRVQLYQLRHLPLRLPDVKVLHSPLQGGAAADAGAGDGADSEVARLTQLAWQRRAHGGCPEGRLLRSTYISSLGLLFTSQCRPQLSHKNLHPSVFADPAFDALCDVYWCRVSNALLQLDWKSAFGRFLTNPPATTADRKSLLQALSLLYQLSRRMREAGALAIATATASCFVPVLAASPSPGAWQTHAASGGIGKDAMATAVERRVRECILSLLLSLLMRFPSICPTLAATALPSILSSEYLGNACGHDGSTSRRHNCTSGAAALPRHAHEAGGVTDAPTTMLRRLAADVLGAMMAADPERGLQATMLQEVAMAAVNSIAHVIPDSFQGKGSSQALVTLLRVLLVALPNTRDLAIDSDLVTALCGECDSPPLWLSRLACDRESAMRAAGHAVLAELLSEPRFSDKLLPAQSPAAGNGWSALLSCARAGLDMGRECAAAATQGMAAVAQHAPLVELGALGEGYGRAVRLGDAVSAAVADKSALPLVDGPLHSTTASLMALLNSTGQHGNEDTAGPGSMLQTPSAIPAAVFTALATVLERHVDLSLQLLGACQQLLTAMLSADAWRHQLQLDRCTSHTTNSLGSGVAMAQRLAQSMAQLLASVFSLIIALCVVGRIELAAAIRAVARLTPVLSLVVMMQCASGAGPVCAAPERCCHAQALALDLPQHLWQLWPVAAAAEVSSTATIVGGSGGGSGLMCALLRLLCGLTHGSAAARHCLLFTGPPATRASAARGEWPKETHTLLHRVMTLALSTKGVSPPAAALAAAVLRNACLSGECHTLMMQANFFADCSGQLEVLAGLTGQTTQGGSKALAAATRAGGLGLILVNATLDSDSIKALLAPGVGCARALESLLSATQCPSVPSLTQAACLLARNLALHRTAAATTPTTQALLPPLLCAALQRFSTAAATAAAAKTPQAAVGDVETANAASACAVAVLCSSSGRGGKEHNQHGRDGAWSGGGAVHDALRTAAAAVASVASQQSGQVNMFSAAGTSTGDGLHSDSAATGYKYANRRLQRHTPGSGALCALQKNVAVALALLKAQDNSGQHCVTDDN
ncbi:hypothetical protein JKP88DRAFT_246167 [Tribonema minus]|uniref:Uncharacterized protein n=1 Tax=Tribonema minus TaxID=303371 RepID=A0A835Z242_9STRA|nr:hypothetical protein JKP88DRAFT_246167 [Tribonema minus]